MVSSSPIKAVSVFPNPTTDHINVEFNNETAKQVNLELCTLNGQVVFSEKMDVEFGYNKRRIELKGFTNEVYILKIKDQSNQTIKTLKIVKQ
jgi:hypothetical protein